MYMQTVNGDGRDGLYVEVNICIEQLGGLVGNIDQWERVLPQMAHITRTHWILRVHVNS